MACRRRRSGAGIGAVATSAYGRAVSRFVLDSRVELRKIVWPEQRETGITTAVVFAFVVHWWRVFLGR